jgi:hypothetical protein
VLLDGTVDVQNVGELMLTDMPQPQQKQNTITWQAIDNQYVVGYSMYDGSEQINDEVIVDAQYEYSGSVNIKPVLAGGYETVFSSSGTQGDGRGAIAPSFLLLKNPTHGRLVVDYQIPRSGAVSLKIFDISGRLVKNIVDGIQKPGHYSAVWDGTDRSGHMVSAGIYFVQFICPDYVRTEKSIFLR